MTSIYTIGHSNKPGEQLAELAKRAGVQTIIDVRTKPVSRYNPQFNRKALEHLLPLFGITYEWRGSNLGGLGTNVQFEETLDELVQRARGGERLAVMCSEADYKSCHRHSMLEPEFLGRGVDVTHVMWKGQDVTVRPDTPGAAIATATLW